MCVTPKYCYRRHCWRVYLLLRKQTYKTIGLTVCLYACSCHNKEARKLCYRKDNRAMRSIHGCPEKFRESLSTPTATFAGIFNWLLFRSTRRMCVQNLKFVALAVPDITKGTQKIRAVPVPRSLFPFLNGLLFEWNPAKFEVRGKFVATRSWDNRGYSKKLRSLCVRTPTLPFLQNV